MTTPSWNTYPNKYFPQNPTPGSRDIRSIKDVQLYKLGVQGTAASSIDPRNQVLNQMASPYDKNLASMIETLLTRVQSLHVLTPKLGEIWDYLLYHGDILNLVELASQLARDSFPVPSQLSLEIHHDAETADQSLTLYVRQNQYEENIMERIDLIRDKLGEIRSDWFIPFFVTSDFQWPA